MDGRTGEQVRSLVARGAEDERSTVRIPGRSEHVEVAARQLPGPAARSRGRHEQVRPSLQESFLVRSPAARRDPPCGGGHPVPGCLDEEPRRSCGCPERDLLPVRRPCEAPDVVACVGHAARLATVERQQPHLGRRIDGRGRIGGARPSGRRRCRVVGVVGLLPAPGLVEADASVPAGRQERQACPVRREPRVRVVGQPRGELARPAAPERHDLASPAAPERHEPQRPLVLDPGDGPPDDDGRAARRVRRRAPRGRPGGGPRRA